MKAIIRTDKWTLFSLHKKQRTSDLLVLNQTIHKYRELVRFLCPVIKGHWLEIVSLIPAKQVPFVEVLFNQTKQNPKPKYGKFFNHGSRFYKFPSYLRRAAIVEAIGLISSFSTRYRTWQSGTRKRRTAKPPQFNSVCGVYPSLYKTHSIQYGENWVKIKVFKDSDWKWLTLGIKAKGTRHLSEQSTRLSPALILRNGKIQLSVPFRIKASEYEGDGKVCGVDLGINTTAVCAVVDRLGGIHGSQFIHDGAALDKRDKHLKRVSRKARLTMQKGGKLHKGFAKVHYRKAKQINVNLANHVARSILNFAVKHGCTQISIENLKGWKPKGGRKRSSLKQRFHGWMKSAIVNQLRHIAQESGIKIDTVYARGTSSNAYDGSGRLKRDSKNYALATFKSGKKFNCDLNAALNIAARSIYNRAMLTLKKGESQSSKSTSWEPRSQVTLSTLWLDAQSNCIADSETPTTALTA